jgi:PhzF family phenazine biosynthesis protein
MKFKKEGDKLMSVQIYQVDAFTKIPFRGNPAAVCILGEPRDDSWMQAVAKEMNLSETAFLHPKQDGYHLRWFTPEVEVELCGHATLASSHVLWETGLLDPEEQARFYTQSGLLTAKLRGDEIEMDFPARPESPSDIPRGLSEALGANPRYVGKTQYDLLVELGTAEIVRDLTPDYIKLKQLSARGIMVTSEADMEGYDFISRFFAPHVGINEDPVTGSAHCSLGPFWSKRLGKHELVAFQASARGGEVKVRMEGDHVFLGGRAVTVLWGELVEP